MLFIVILFIAVITSCHPSCHAIPCYLSSVECFPCHSLMKVAVSYRNVWTQVLIFLASVQQVIHGNCGTVGKGEIRPNPTCQWAHPQHRLRSACVKAYMYMHACINQWSWKNLQSYSSEDGLVYHWTCCARSTIDQSNQVAYTSSQPCPLTLCRHRG